MSYELLVIGYEAGKMPALLFWSGSVSLPNA